MQLAGAAAAAAVLVLGLGCEKSKPDEQDQVEPEAARPRPEQPRELGGGAVVVLLPSEGLLFPVACWDPKTKQAGDAGDCLTKFPAGAVRRWECEGDGSEFQGLSLDTVEVDSDELAVVPAGADIHPVGLARHSEAAKPVRKRLTEVASKHKGKKIRSPMTSIELVMVDVDGDGRQENLYSVTFTNEDLEPEYEWSGLIFESEAAPGEYKVLFSHDLETMTLRHAFDLDGDGKLELVVSTDYYEGSYLHLARIVDGELDLTVIHGCGA